MSNQYKTLLNHFGNRRPVLNIVLDGYGLGQPDQTNAIYQARTPLMDSLQQQYASGKLFAHGKHVGLPGETDLGGSEVGHLSMGAGKHILQGPTLIANSIADGSFFQTPALQKALDFCQQGALHLLGLLSDGNIHSHIEHFIAVIQEAARQKIKKCFIHALLDGRDVGIQTAQDYFEVLENLFSKIMKQNPGFEYAFASGGGREVITMDRDLNWDKVEAGWKTHVLGQSGRQFKSPLEAIEHFRRENPDLIDQDCPAFNIVNAQGDIPTISDGDSVIFMNFRGDRAIEITRAFTEESFDMFKIKNRPEIYFAGMMVYDADSNMPAHRIVGSPVVERPFGKRLVELGLRQFRLAETQKYAHVTFFYNGGYRQPLDPSIENYFLIESDKISSFALAPQMKALEIARQAVLFIESDRYDFGLINFANTDMVGHTGDFQAVITATEIVDKALGIVLEALTKKGGIAIVTADHGNADEMIITNKKTKKTEISTKHSINPVPVIIFDPLYKGQYSLKTFQAGEDLNLSMIAATNYILLGLEVPDDLSDHLFKL